MLSNDPSQAKSVTRKFSFFYLKKICLKHVSKTIIALLEKQNAS